MQTCSGTGSTVNLTSCVSVRILHSLSMLGRSLRDSRHSPHLKIRRTKSGKLRHGDSSTENLCHMQHCRCIKQIVPRTKAGKTSSSQSLQSQRERCHMIAQIAWALREGHVPRTHLTSRQRKQTTVYIVYAFFRLLSRLIVYSLSGLWAMC